VVRLNNTNLIFSWNSLSTS